MIRIPMDIVSEVTFKRFRSFRAISMYILILLLLRLFDWSYDQSMTTVNSGHKRAPKEQKMHRIFLSFNLRCAQLYVSLVSNLKAILFKYQQFAFKKKSFVRKICLLYYLGSGVRETKIKTCFCVSFITFDIFITISTWIHKALKRMNDA